MKMKRLVQLLFLLLLVWYKLYSDWSLEPEPVKAASLRALTSYGHPPWLRECRKIYLDVGSLKFHCFAPVVSAVLEKCSPNSLAPTTPKPETLNSLNPQGCEPSEKSPNGAVPSREQHRRPSPEVL